MPTKLPINKKTKMSDLINNRLKIHTIDNRTYTGTLLSFDKHLNLVLSDTEEARITKKSLMDLRSQSQKKASNKLPINSTTTTSTPLFPTEIPKSNKPDLAKRHVGLIILRGEQIVNFTIESGPSSELRVGTAGATGTSRSLKQPVGKLKKIA
ncbi:SNRPB [Candida margitis]|uniref:SNRPB n=1 Tax=Candida margitis TaxID=1775924 RepID=UPI00222680E9|nr:SNRPB [Candida margitis]KAI5969702.1 SNRPB [Candida margitis]